MPNSAKRKRTPPRWNRLNREIDACQKCTRLIDYCREVAHVKRRAYINETYWGGPVSNFGDPYAELLLVGLAPGAHGANRTGRMFTGDRSGDWLYKALFKAGFANQPGSTHLQDGLQLTGCAITNICHCAPPQNKPTRQEVLTCQPWFEQLVGQLPIKVFLAFGQIAWRGVIDFMKDTDVYSGPIPKFGHGHSFKFNDGRILLGSYHPSQQNTFTGRLTESMFNSVFRKANRFLDKR